MGRTFDVALLRLLQQFEKLTHAKAVDVVERDGLWFIVEETSMGKAIGRGGSTIQRLERIFKNPIRIVAYSSDPTVFVRNLLYPIQPKDVVCEGEALIISDPSAQVRGRIIGRDKANLQWLSTVLGRHFGRLHVEIREKL